MDDFLLNREPTTWAPPAGFPAALKPAGVFVQQVPNGLEVVLAQAPRKTSAGDLRDAWKKRRSGRASPVLLLVRYRSAAGDRMSICGPVGEQPVVHHDLEVTQVERLVDVALGEPSHHAATRFLLASLPELDSPFLGLRNIGLLATQELKAGVPERSDWSSARRKSQPLLKLRGRRLVEKLGFEIHTLATNASMLTINGRRHAVAVFCDEGETFETASRRFGNASPVSQALALADRESVDWVLLTRSSEIRLYSARLNAGVGRKGRTETYVELNLSLLPTVSAGYLHLLFSADALTDQGTLSEILDRSADFAAELAVRLRERVYHEAVPALARAVAARLSSDSMAVDLTEADLADAYEQVMVILFRLLFVAYAEDKDLLPYRSNGRYADHSLSRKAQRLTEDRREGREEYDGRATSFWDGITKLWDAVNDGNSDWRVPAYNGGLFSSDPKISPSGAALTNLSLTNAEFAPVLAAILIDDSPEGPGPVDFRSLSVREFGTIYEGLLESKLSVAPDDLTVKKVKGDLHYVPAGANEDVEVKGGEVYFHNRSGARKATGSYFTKPFAVEHLLDHALEPALDDHLTRLGALRDTDDDAGVAAAFFDFRCADIAMGSAHFLVSAVDRIEARLSAWLSLHPVPAITAELNRLRDSAMGELGDLGDGIEIETGSLLRRQIARHCVYGVDKNRVAVELARLAIWVHTFVPGLPLSFLDHNLVHGDSLTGIGTLDEVVAAFDADADPTAPSLFRSQLIGLLRKAEDALQRLAHTSDASKHEIDEARAAHTDAREAVAGARAVFDVVTAHRAGVCGLPENFDAAILAKVADGEGVRDEITRLMPVHFPAAFPEVFLRDTPGFDCLIGNPPWEKVMVERKIWWGRYLPGIRSLPEGQMNARIDRFAAARPELVAAFNTEMAHNAQVRSVILNGPYPGIGRSHPDLYKAFAWRNWHLSRPFGGHVGLVLPRTAVSDAGMAAWRKEIVGVEREREREGLRIIIATLVNHKGWVFEGIHNSYTVALAVLRRRPPLQLVSTPGSGLSTMSMAATASPSSRFAGLGQTPSRGGGFEAQGDEPCVAIYPGPAISLQLFHEIVDGRPQLIPVTQFGSWSDNCAFPQLPTKSAFQVFLKMREAPSFGESKLDPQRRARVESDAQPSRAEPSRAEPSRAEPSRAEPSLGARTQRHQRQASVQTGYQSRWNSRLVWEFDAGKDKWLFARDAGKRAVSQRGTYWPVYTGKSFNIWDAETGTYAASVEPSVAREALQRKRENGHRNSRSAFSNMPSEWVSDPSTLPCLAPRIAIRDTTNSTNTRTIICALVPKDIVITHQAPYLLSVSGTVRDEALLLGVLSSMILDWYARRVVELHLTASHLNNFPIPDPGEGHPVRDRVVEIAGRLAAVDDRFEEWAAEVGVPVGSANDEAVKKDLIHELDACVANLYELDEDDLEVIYTTFDEKRPDRYSDRLAAVVEHFRRFK